MACLCLAVLGCVGWLTTPTGPDAFAQCAQNAMQQGSCGSDIVCKCMHEAECRYGRPLSRCPMKTIPFRCHDDLGKVGKLGGIAAWGSMARCLKLISPVCTDRIVQVRRCAVSCHDRERMVAMAAGDGCVLGHSKQALQRQAARPRSAHLPTRPRSVQPTRTPTRTHAHHACMDYTCMRLQMCMWHMYMCTCACACTYLHVRTYIQICINTYVCTYTHACACRVCTHTHAHERTRAHLCVYAHTYTQY